MKIYLAFVRTYPHINSLRRAADLFNYSQSHFFAELTEIESDILEYEDYRLDHVVFDKAAPAVRRAFPGKSHVVYVTDNPFDNNSFSATHGDVAIVTTHDWSEKYAPPSLAAYVAREMVLSSLCFSGELLDADIDRVSMEPSMGCVFDFCADKSDVRFGLAAGYIHPQTEAKLHQFGIHDEPIEAAEQILNVIRLESIGKPKKIRPDMAFIVMKFSVNDENANAYIHGIRPALEEFGLRPFRADEDPRTEVISDAVTEMIDNCRLVVIKIDEKNPNVFFELGYSVARRKEILLICETAQVANVPSDIKGWKLLTYSAPDYISLKSSLISALERRLPHRRKKEPAI